MRVIHIPDEMGQFDGYREGVNVFASEIDAHGRRVVSPLALRDFPELFEWVTVSEVEYEPAIRLIDGSGNFHVLTDKTRIYTETPFEPWISSFGETSPINPRSEGWVFPANVGWEEELTARNMQWEYIEVTKDSEGVWASVKSYAGGLWDTLKGLFS
jgi:hypothetical protein